MIGEAISRHRPGRRVGDWTSSGLAKASVEHPRTVRVLLGTPVDYSVEQFLGALRRTEPGQQVAVPYWRDGAEQDASIPVGSTRL